MKTNEITEGNRLIAEFMNLDIGDFTSYNEEGRRVLQDQDLLYHEYWDWLMPVVEKIEKMGVSTYNYFSAQDKYRITFLGKDHNYFDHTLSGDSKIQCIWEIVVLFIKWYNENK